MVRGAVQICFKYFFFVIRLNNDSDTKQVATATKINTNDIMPKNIVP